MRHIKKFEDVKKYNDSEFKKGDIVYSIYNRDICTVIKVEGFTSYGANISYLYTVKNEDTDDIISSIREYDIRKPTVSELEEYELKKSIKNYNL